MLSTPCRTRVFVAGSILTWVVPGTCLIQTTIFMLAALALSQFESDDIPEDLVGALEYLRDLGISHHLLRRIGTHETSATHDLDGIGRDFHGHIVWEDL